MKLKLTKDGHAIVKDGRPIYIRDDGTEQGIDGAAAMKLALNKHFETSPVMASLKIPHDIVAATFGGAFRIEGGKLVAVDKDGIQMYSSTNHGAVATFDEALAQLVDRYQHKAMIQREAGAQTPTPTPTTGQQSHTATSISRLQFDALPQDSRAKFLKEGGRIGDATNSPAHAAPPAPSDGAKVMTRAVFDVTPPVQVAAFFKAGGKIVD
jgi:hypothetical protein